MKAALIIICLFSVHLLSFAQDSTQIRQPRTAFSQTRRDTVFTRLYGMIGGAVPFSEDQQFISSVSFVKETRNNFLLAIRSYSQAYDETKYGPNTAWFGSNLPQHVLGDLNISVGKYRNDRKIISVSVSSGPSFVYYEMPVNVKVIHSGGMFISSTKYEYDKRKYYLLGWSVRGDFAVVPWRLFGFSLGAFYNYNRKVPNGGLSLDLLFGRLAQRKKV